MYGRSVKMAVNFAARASVWGGEAKGAVLLEPKSGIVG